MINLKKINQYSYVSEGDVYILSYFNTNKQIHYCGTHKGEISGKNIIVEAYNTIKEIVKRVKELNLILTEEQAHEIMYRSKLRGNELSDEIKNEIFLYLMELNGN